MSNQKSIIGRKYIACGMAKAIDLNLKQEVSLGTKQQYTIIDDPYVCEYYRPTLAPFDLSPRKVKMMAVKVRDDRTGLTYAVEYHPANLVCDDRVDVQPGEPVDFATRAGQIAEELKAMFDPAGGEFPTNAALHSLRFRMTGTIKHRRASGFSAVEVVECRRLSLRRVPRTPKSSKL